MSVNMKSPYKIILEFGIPSIRAKTQIFSPVGLGGWRITMKKKTVMVESAFCSVIMG